MRQGLTIIQEYERKNQFPMHLFIVLKSFSSSRVGSWWNKILVKIRKAKNTRVFGGTRKWVTQLTVVRSARFRGQDTRVQNASRAIFFVHAYWKRKKDSSLLTRVFFDRLASKTSVRRASLPGFCARRLFFSLCAGCGCLRSLSGMQTGVCFTIKWLSGLCEDFFSFIENKKIS